MKQAVPLIFVGVLGVGVGYLLHSQPPQAPQVSQQAKAQAIQAGMTQAAPGKVVHKFEDETKLKEFGALWLQRQAHVVRSAMLEGYWNSEQANLTQLNRQLNSQYSLDASKSYVLNTDRKVILEREAPPAEAATPPTPTADEAATPTPAAPAANAEEGKIAHTFTDEAQMQSFAQLWQQRQGVLVRMAVLKSYWESEKNILSELDAKLVSDYQMDVTKQYTFDNQQRALIEREAPPASPAAAAVTPPTTGQAGTGQAAQAQPQTAK